MLAVSWLFIIHNVCITCIFVGIMKQLFYIKLSMKKSIIFVVWIQVVFIFNDFVIEALYPLEYKYLAIFIGFVLAFAFIIKMSKVSSVLVMTICLTINGIVTNINILALLLNQFESYGLAIEDDFIQYTSLVMITCMFYMVSKTFNIRILDISKYN